MNMFTDWTTIESGPEIIIHQFFGPPRLGFINGINGDPLTLGTPIDGSGSLVWHFLQSAYKGQIYRSLDSAFTSGFLRTIWHVKQNPSETGTYAFGIYCYANQTNLSGGTGECYLLSFSYFDDEYRIRMFKSKEGVDISPAPDPPENWGLLVQTDVGAWSPNTTLIVEFKWFKTPSSVILTYSRGSTADPLNIFTDLVPILTYEDTESPLTTITNVGGQGFWGDSSTIIGQLTYFMDITQGQPSLPGGL